MVPNVKADRHNTLWCFTRIPVLTGLRRGKNTFKAKRSEPSRRPNPALSRAGCDQREYLNCATEYRN